MNCVFWSIGVVSFQGMGHLRRFPRFDGKSVTDVLGLNCYLCVWTVPMNAQHTNAADCLAAWVRAAFYPAADSYYGGRHKQSAHESLHYHEAHPR